MAAQWKTTSTRVMTELRKSKSAISPVNVLNVFVGKLRLGMMDDTADKVSLRS